MEKRLEPRDETKREGEDGAPWPPQGSGPQTLVVSYNPGVKIVIALVSLLVLPLIFYCATGENFVVHLLGVAGFAVLALYLVDCLDTGEITLEPDRIVKRRLLAGETVIPAQWAVMTHDQHAIRFYHGSSSNVRERITIRRFMVSRESADAVVDFAENVYGIRLRQHGGSGDEALSFSGSGAGKGRQVTALLLGRFHEAVSSQKLMLAFFAAFTVIVIFIVGLSDDFSGLGPAFPLAWLRGAAILLAVGGYFLLRRLNPVKVAGTGTEKLPWDERFREVEHRATASALIATGVVVLGFILFLLTGNLLDFYLFLAVACLYYADFFPRLSVWQQAEGVSRERAAAGPRAPLSAPVPARRSSLQVSLVLMGALAVTSYGENRHYLYKNKKDCLDDWGSEQSCQEAPAGSTYYRSGYYYGPRYGGGRGIRSVGAVTVSRGGFGSLGGFHASFGG